MTFPAESWFSGRDARPECLLKIDEGVPDVDVHG
jgi:hypothetical protein